MWRGVGILRMAEYEKLLSKLQSNPKDFTYRELQSIMSRNGYKEDSKGKTSGSRVEYKGKETTLRLHKPHGGRNFLHDYQIKAVIEFLEKEGVL